MRFSLLQSTAVLAVFSPFLLHNAHAELPTKAPETYGKENTVLLNVQAAAASEVAKLQSEASNLHFKWANGEEFNEETRVKSTTALREFVTAAAELKAKEAASWSSWWSGVSPLTLIIEPSTHVYASTEEGVAQCKKELYGLQSVLDNGLNDKVIEQLTVWKEGVRNKKMVTVVFGAHIPLECYQHYMSSFDKIPLFVGLNPTITKSTDIDFLLDTSKRIVMVSRKWPNSRDAVQGYLAQLPHTEAKLRLLDVPLDLETMEGRFAQRVMEYLGVMAKGRLLYSLNYTPAPAPPAPSPSEEPATPSETPAPPQPEPSEEPISPPSPPDADKRDDKSDETEPEEDAVDPKPEPNPKPDTKEDDGAAARTFAGIVLLLVTLTGLGGAVMHYRKQTAGGDASSYRAMA